MVISRKEATKMLKNFHFVNNKKVTLIILAVVLVVGIASFIISGFNIDIDFSGGNEMQINLGTDVTPEVCKNINSIIESNEKLGHDYVSSTTQSTADPQVAIIRTGTAPLTIEQQTALRDAIIEAYPDADPESEQFTNIAASIGASTTQKAVLAVVVAVALMLIYIWIRFDINSGLAAVICLAHDLFVVLIAYSIFNIPVNSNIIAVFLTILGYSINATIVLFDRVRENRRKHSSETSFGDIINASTHETLRRSIFTTLTTLVTIGMIFIMGVDSIRNFALPLCVGIVAGLFSSLFMSGMLWDTLNKVIKPRAKKSKKA